MPPVLSPARRELLGWFRDRAAPLADAYEGAIRLIQDPSFPGRVHFIAHAMRDIADRLIFVLDPQLLSSRVQYENELDKIEKRWQPIDKIDDSADQASGSDTVSIDRKVATLLSTLIESHRERRRRPSNYELLFRFLIREDPSRGELSERLVHDFKALRDWAMGLTHLRAKRAISVSESELQDKFLEFESMLHSFVGEFFTGIERLDEILQQANR